MKRGQGLPIYTQLKYLRVCSYGFHPSTFKAITLPRAYLCLSVTDVFLARIPLLK